MANTQKLDHAITSFNGAMLQLDVTKELLLRLRQRERPLVERSGPRSS